MPSTNFYYPKWHVVIGENDITHEKYLSIIVYQGGAGHIGLFICEKEIDVGHKIILNRIGGEECIDAVFMSEDNLTFQIDAVHTGELIITQLDLNKKIVSGTFFFDAVNASGEKIEIRDGRFDLIINQIEP